jgi:hypothetical protein
LALVAAIVALGRTPRCVLELPDAGQGRLERLLKHIGGCAASIHDLSRVGTPARFNMPFELGLTVALARHARRRHKYFLFDREPYRLDRVLSDMKGRDPMIHGGSAFRTIVAVCSVLRKPGGRTDPRDVMSLYRQLEPVSRELKHKHHEPSIYTAAIFEELVIACSKLAESRKLI